MAMAMATAVSASSSTASKDRRRLQHFCLDDFETVQRCLGSGSYGSVDKVSRRSTGEFFAMKQVPKQKVLEHGMVDYLLREIKTQMKLSHPNILVLHYYFEDEHNVLLLLEYAEHGSLFSMLKRQRRLKDAQAAHFFADVASALRHLHGRGVAHRDVKPENILLCAAHGASEAAEAGEAGEAGRRRSTVAKLADFGWCAELSAWEGARQTFCGTWDYLSPEMVMSEPHDQRVDIWALGVLLYEMLVGSAPFAAPSQAKIMNRIISVDLVFDGLEPPVPEAQALMRALLAKMPAARLSLDRALQHKWVQHHCTSPGEQGKAPTLLPHNRLWPSVGSTASPGGLSSCSSGLSAVHFEGPATAAAARKLEGWADGPATTAAATATAITSLPSEQIQMR